MKKRKGTTRRIDPAELAEERAQQRCDRMRLSPPDRAFYFTVYDRVREAELSGLDTEPLWRQYRNDPAADLAVAAYVEGIASTRKMPRPRQVDE